MLPNEGNPFERPLGHFPLPHRPDDAGLVAVGGRLTPASVLEAYSVGIFPWMKDPDILWFSPDPRMVLETRDVRVASSLERRLRQKGWKITLDQVFSRVMEACAATPRQGQDGTWIDGEFIDAYTALHRQGHGHSVEVWWQGDLVGGLYGLALGRHFFGESMFHHRSDASKIALVTLCRQLSRWGFPRIDCQAHTPHLESMGGHTIPRAQYLSDLAGLIRGDGKVGPWILDPDLGGNP